MRRSRIPGMYGRSNGPAYYEQKRKDAERRTRAVGFDELARRAQAVGLQIPTGIQVPQPGMLSRIIGRRVKV